MVLEQNLQIWGLLGLDTSFCTLKKEARISNSKKFAVKIRKDEPNPTITIGRNSSESFIQGVFQKKVFSGGGVHLTRWVSASTPQHGILLQLVDYLVAFNYE